MASSFRYLGWNLTAVDDDWPAVIKNLWKEQKMWACISRVLGREGSGTIILVRFYLAVVQATLLFGSEAWFVTPHMARNLGGVHHQVARRITVKLPCHQSDGSCNFPPLAEAMREAGLEELEIYDGGQ